MYCLGVNLRTGRQGVFPSAYAVDMEYNDFDPTTPKVKQERFLLGYLGSVETLSHKGNSVICQAVKKFLATKHKPHSCILEVSDQGLRVMVNKGKLSVSQEIQVQVSCSRFWRFVLFKYLFDVASTSQTEAMSSVPEGTTQHLLLVVSQYFP